MMRGLIFCHHSYTFFLFFIALLRFGHVFSTNILSSTETLTISSSQTIVSPGEVFELGFFKTTTSSENWYLGIWYKSSYAYKRTYVWIANRDNPFSNSTGTLKISDASNLILLDHFDTLIWSTNVTKATKSPLVAELLDNGNFVLRDSNSNDFLWESFDFPVDTILPEMKFGRDKFLISWRSPYDPSSGDFSFNLETSGLPEFHIRANDSILYRTGPWNGLWFNGMPKMQDWTYTFIESNEEVAYTFKVTNMSSYYSRFTLSSNGIFQWFSTLDQPDMSWILLEDKCDTYMRCGTNTYCDSTISPSCNCIKGFEPKSVDTWDLEDNGCVTKSLGSYGFVEMKKMKLPETSGVVVDKTIGLKECKERCLNDLNCTAFANSDIQNGGSGCVIWIGELADMRTNVVDGHDIYVKISSAPTIRHVFDIMNVQEIGILFLVMQIYMWF